MQRIRNFLAGLGRDQRGLTTVEYAIVLVLIVAVSVKLWDGFGAAVTEQLAKDTKTIEDSFKPGAK